VEQCLIRRREKGGSDRWQPVSPTLMAGLENRAAARNAPCDGRLLRYRTEPPLAVDPAGKHQRVLDSSHHSAAGGTLHQLRRSTPLPRPPTTAEERRPSERGHTNPAVRSPSTPPGPYSRDAPTTCHPLPPSSGTGAGKGRRWRAVRRRRPPITPAATGPCSGSLWHVDGWLLPVNRWPAGWRPPCSWRSRCRWRGWDRLGWKRFGWR
jgi:hypothetical protein